jgi:hypothetical protein
MTRGLIVYSRRTRGGSVGDHFLVCPPMIATEAHVDEIMTDLTARSTPSPTRPGWSAPRDVPILITCAVTGSIHTPSMSPHLPGDARGHRRAGGRGGQAGAAILHLHARDPARRPPLRRPRAFHGLPARDRGADDAVVNITTGGSAIMTLDDRLAGARAAEPEMCSLNMGSDEFRALPRRRRASPSGSTTGRSLSWRTPTTWCSRTRPATSRRCWRRWANGAARGSSSSATISAI